MAVTDAAETDAAKSLVERVEAAVAQLQAAIADFDPGRLGTSTSKRLVDLFTRGERLCAAGKGMAARRIDAAMSWKQEGHRSAAHWLASATGVSVGAATRSLQTARQLERLPHTQEAFRAGEVSEAQAAQIATTAALDPNLEGELLDAARSGSSFKGFRDTCRRAAACVRDDQAWARHLHETRAVHTWTDEIDQAWRMDVRLAHDDAAFVHRALEDMTDEVFRQARSTGHREPRAAYRADALVALIRNGPCKPIEVRLQASDRALARGYVEAGEICEIDGIGPVPVTVARHLLDDSRVTALGRDDVEIATVSSPNRNIPARLRRWLEATYRECGVTGCAVDQRLEVDHVVPVEEHGPTSKENTWRICRHHHKLKTYLGWQVVEEAPGARRLVAPDAEPRGPDPP